jgi:hypothetical protein
MSFNKSQCEHYIAVGHPAILLLQFKAFYKAYLVIVRNLEVRAMLAIIWHKIGIMKYHFVRDSRRNFELILRQYIEGYKI